MNIVAPLPFESAGPQYPENFILVGIMRIVREFLPYKKPDDQAGCDADSEPADLDHRKQFFPKEIPPGDFDEVFQHKLKKAWLEGKLRETKMVTCR
jgi:hypothetical protein